MVAVVTAALAGAIIGFLPYNFNPAKIFMGDTGSNFLGFILATLSIQGLFKFYVVVSFAVPFLILGLPLFDMVSSIIRRVAKGLSPMTPDRGHIHHKLIDMGLSQKQAVTVLYAITCILGITGVILASSGAGKAVLLLLAVILVCTIGYHVLSYSSKKGNSEKTEETAVPSSTENTAQAEEKTSCEAEEPQQDEQKPAQAH
jgi:UDP-GlcNAc:undecaprenyl-phosphate GlcNAc-1-phosphate transferase